MTGQRDPQRFARSTAYVAQDDTIRVDASALMTVYAHVHVLEHAAAGADRRTANVSGFQCLSQVLAPLTGVAPGQPPKAATVKCVAFRAAVIAEALSAFLPRPDPATVPWATIARDDNAELLVLGEATRRWELGTELGAAVRGAYDQAEHRPRRRRAPVSDVTERVGWALTSAWWGLLHAHLAGDLWLLHDRLEAKGLDDDHRPTWALD